MICSVFDKGKTLDYLHHGRLSFIIPQQDETSDYEIAKLAKYRLATLMAIINNKRGWKERTRGPVTTRSVGVPRNAEMVRQTDPLHNFTQVTQAQFASLETTKNPEEGFASERQKG